VDQEQVLKRRGRPPKALTDSALSDTEDAKVIDEVEQVNFHVGVQIGALTTTGLNKANAALKFPGKELTMWATGVGVMVSLSDVGRWLVPHTNITSIKLA
jgi:hypothetical protein